MRIVIKTEDLPGWKNTLGMGIFLFVLLSSLASQGQVIRINPMRIDTSLAPGEARQEVIEIHNLSEEPLIVRLSIADFALSETGAVRILEAGTSSPSIAGWLTLREEELQVDAGETRSVTLSILRPADSPALARWGCLVVEGSEPTGGAQPEGIGIRLTMKYVVAILQNDPTNSQKGGRVTELNVELVNSAEGNSPAVLVSATFANATINILQADVRFDVRDMTGETVVFEETQSRVILPETRRTFKAEFPASEWLPGQYVALVIIDYGGELLTGGQWPFEIPEE